MTEAISFNNVFPQISDPLFPYLDIDTLGKLPLVNHAFNTHLKNKTLFQHVQTAARSIYQLNQLQKRQCAIINAICKERSENLSSNFAITEIQLIKMVPKIRMALKSLIELEQMQRCLSLLVRLSNYTTANMISGLDRERIKSQFEEHPFFIKDTSYSPSLLHRKIPSLGIVATKQYAKMLFANRNFESLNDLLERCSGCPQLVHPTRFMPTQFAWSCFEKLYFDDDQKHSEQEIIHAYMSDPNRQSNLEQPPPIGPQWILKKIVDRYSITLQTSSLGNEQMWKQIGSTENVISQLRALHHCHVKNFQNSENELCRDQVISTYTILSMAQAFLKRSLPKAALKCLEVGLEILHPMIEKAETILATQPAGNAVHYTAKTVKDRYIEYCNQIYLLKMRELQN